MSKGYGFHIRRLVLQGESKPDASIEFTPGCNIIAGASDTGKTFILQCIDYLLGSRTLPKDIPEANGYRFFFLEIESRQGKVFTLMRDLHDSRTAYLSEAAVAEFWKLHEQNKVEVLTPTKIPSAKKTSISDVLLRISGFSGSELIRINADNKKRSLSFRDVSHLTVIQEDDIISERSPAYQLHVTNETAEASVFNLLVSGDDSSHLTEVKDPQMRRSQLNAQLQLIDEMSAALSSKLNRNLGEIDKDNDVSIEQEIAKINDQYIEVEQALATQRALRQDIWLRLEDANTKLTSVTELLIRFKLLKSQYQSDLDRLGFLSEGEYYLSHLNSVECSCPLCGSVVPVKSISADLRDSIKAELSKISRNLSDLNTTIELNDLDRKDIEATIRELSKQKNECEREISHKLQPYKNSIQEELEKLVSRQRELIDINASRKQLDDFTKKRDELQVLLDSIKKEQGSPGGFDREMLSKFTKEFKDLLIKWVYLSGGENVDFNLRKQIFDFTIDGIPRYSHGKGVRALLYSAFVIALMRHSFENGLPHPLLVILDTPVNSFKEKDSGIEDPEQIKRITNAFFRDMASVSEDMQIIILENQEPPEDVKKMATYHHFGGNEQKGRAGFIPIK